MFLPEQEKYWKCLKNKEHYYKAQIKNKSLKKGKYPGCSVCEGKYIIESASLASKFPEISKEWHPKLNLLKPEEVFPFSNKKVFGFAKMKIFGSNIAKEQ